jgi:hypothetical protein
LTTRFALGGKGDLGGTTLRFTGVGALVIGSSASTEISGARGGPVVAKLPSAAGQPCLDCMGSRRPYRRNLCRQGSSVRLLPLAVAVLAFQPAVRYPSWEWHTNGKGGDDSWSWKDYSTMVCFFFHWRVRVIWSEWWLNGVLVMAATSPIHFLCGCILLRVLLLIIGAFQFAFKFPVYPCGLSVVSSADYGPVRSFGSHPCAMYTCPICFLGCRTSGGLTQHQNSAHRQFTPESDDDNNNPVSRYKYYPHLTGMYTFSVLR